MGEGVPSWKEESHEDPVVPVSSKNIPPLLVSVYVSAQGSPVTGEGILYSAIVAATANDREDLPQFIPGVLRCSPPGTDIIVVDVGSTGGSREYVREMESTDAHMRSISNEFPHTLARAHPQGNPATAPTLRPFLSI